MYLSLRSIYLKFIVFRNYSKYYNIEKSKSKELKDEFDMNLLYLL